MTATGIMIGVRFLQEQDSLGEKQLLRVLQHLIPSLVVVQGSFFVYRPKDDARWVGYLEVEKRDGAPISLEEMHLLKKVISSTLKSHIEHRVHPVFMPKNEEEVMRNVLMLSQQLRYTRDLPHLLISFDEQMHEFLYFNVIVARVGRNEDCWMEKLTRFTESGVEFSHDGTRVVGHLRKKYPKEVVFLRAKIGKEQFIRADESVDLYRARQTIVGELTTLFGELRDYNGGMISKEQEVLVEIRKELQGSGGYDDLLMENFFHALTPSSVKTWIDPKAFKTLFLMLHDAMKQYAHQGHCLVRHEEPYNLYLLLLVDNSQVKNELINRVNRLGIPISEMASASFLVHGSACVGYICCSPGAERKALLCATIDAVLAQFA